MDFRNVRSDLEKITGQSMEIDYDMLSEKFASSIKDREDQDMRNEAEYHMAREINARHIDWMKRVVAEELEKEVERVNGSLPVSSVFDALQVVKKASAESPRDIGLSAFAGMLEKKWKRDREASIIAEDFLKLRNYYENNYPKSRVSEVLDKIAKSGYATLPMSDLIEIAGRIRNQQDYEHEINQAGLSGRTPHQKKARAFILALVNGEETL